MATFPKGFLWGAATASYQVEGGIENCDWADAARVGQVPVCGLACDHYTLYESDFDIAKTLRHNAHRFSIEWSRVEPKEGEFDEQEIEHYRSVLKALRARGLEPFVTLYHFTLPTWFSSSGGWTRTDAPDIFARYCAHVVERLAGDTRRFSTINEPLVLAGLGYFRGYWPPFRKNVVTYLSVYAMLARAHNEAYRAIKRVAPDTDVSIVKHTIPFSARGGLHDRVRAWVANWFWTTRFMNRVQQQCDSIGVNYYRPHIFGDTSSYEKTDMGWNIVPEAIYDALVLLAPYKKPLYVTEAGCADAHDRFRAEYIRGTVRGIERALKSGIDVRGYLYWSLLDNYEWREGFEKHFGLVEVNYETLERTIRPSAYAYRDIIVSNGALL